MTLQIRKYREIYGTLQQFSEISDFEIRDFNKIPKRAVQDFKGVVDPSFYYKSTIVRRSTVF